MNKTKMIVGFIFCVSILSDANSDTVQRFFPEQLQQNGRVTLSPSFTPDGKTLYFAQSDCSPIWECPQQLRRSDLTASGWSIPVNVKLPKPGRVDWPSVSPNGEMLIFSWSAEREELANLDISENFDLYTLDLTNRNAVPKPIKTGDINRPRAGQVKTLRYVYNESLPSFTSSGALYFMTERLDGIGERDIYTSKLQTDGSFSTAIPLPPPINSPDRDDGVWVNADESVMLMTYPNRGGQGGPDLFISFRFKGEWSQPMNIGSKINSPYSDFGARLTPDNKSIVFTSDRPFDGQPQGLLQVWIAPIDIEDLKENRFLNL